MTRLFRGFPALLTALLVCLLLVSPAGSGSMGLLGVGGPSGATTPPTVTYVGTIGGATGSGTATFTYASTPLGNPTYIATRRVYVLFTGATSGRTAILSGTSINGVAADLVSNVSTAGANANNMALISAVVTSGTTGSVVVTFNASNFNGTNIYVWNVDNSLLSNPTSPVVGFNDAIAAVGTNTASVAVLTNGIMFVGNTVSGVSTVAISSSDAGVTQDGASFATVAGHVDHLAASAASHVTSTWSGTDDSLLGLWAIK